ncbi:MAG: CBS domain-containing protein [Acidobacteria bacterium]|nr:CBS domain-containing protein [Acidobacteriota bacterium]
MKVKELAAFDLKSCSPDTDLATAAKIMWDCDCGVVPVMNEDRKVVGMVTDRDICIAAATRAARPSDIQVRDVMSGDVAACRADDDIHTALKTMKERRVRRLPVLDREQQLAGIISMNDLVMRAECRAGADVPGETFLDTLKAICAHTREAVPA